MNNFYATVESLYYPEIVDKPFVVGSSTEKNLGIVLSKNYPAREFNIKTGEPILSAKKKCPHLIIVPSHFDRYIAYSKKAIKIYSDYTDRIERFGMDECWLDVTESTALFGDGETIANEIRSRIRNELGLTVSIGVSFNKIFAKLGSDLKKPDATTVLSRENFKEKIWHLNANELLNVGRATTKTLQKHNILTIGDIANTPESFMKKIFGKRGVDLWQFANGYDSSPVNVEDYKSPVKSIGNSTTPTKSLDTYDDIKIVLYQLVESVTERLRKQNLNGKVVQITVKDTNFESYDRQGDLGTPCCCTNEIFEKAFELFKLHHKPFRPVRMIGVRVTNLMPMDCTQLSFDSHFEDIQKQEKLDKTIDSIRAKYGNEYIKRAVAMTDPTLVYDEHEEDMIHMTSFKK
jgi:DNA polymerase-4